MLIKAPQRGSWPLLFEICFELARRLYGLHAIGNVQFFEQRREIEFDGLHAQAEPCGDFHVRLLERVSDPISAKQIFMASAAHQLRTPLAAMLLELGMIEGERARGIEKDIANLSETVDRLLTLARLQAIESPDFVDFNIGAVAEDAVRGLRRWADHSIQILAQHPGNHLGGIGALHGQRLPLPSRADLLAHRGA
jgi:signal transduction histidine kinase